jgi:hypothetical protein
MLIALTLEKSQLSKLLIALTQGCRSDTRKHQELTFSGKFFIFAGANLKKKKEKKKEKRGRRRKEKKREKKKRKSIFIFQHVTDETAMVPKNAMHQYSQYWMTLPPSYILSTHTLSNSCKWRVKQSYWWSKPARCGGVAQRR